MTHFIVYYFLTVRQLLPNTDIVHRAGGSVLGTE